MRQQVTKAFVVTVVLLALLFTALQPVPTFGLGLPAALLFWLLHAGVGLALAVCAARVLGRTRWFGRLPLPLALLVAGLAGAALFAPASLGLERLLPQGPRAEVADDWLDAWGAGGGLRAVLAELLQLLPAYLLAWLLVNATPLLRPLQRPVPAAPEHRLKGGAGGTGATAPPDVDAGDADAGDADAAASIDLLARLPPALGRDIVSISSDLHYLEVATTRGRATVLGTLERVEAELDGRGLRVHRSYWVAFEHVRRLARTARGWHCELSNGERVPVSRRRAGEVKQRLGTGFRRG